MVQNGEQKKSLYSSDFPRWFRERILLVSLWKFLLDPLWMQERKNNKMTRRSLGGGFKYFYFRPYLGK